MSNKKRKPLGNFLIKRSLQVRIIIRILITVAVTGVVTTGFLAFYYGLKSDQGHFYYMSNNIKKDLELLSFVGVILPSLIVAQLASFGIAFGIGLFSSRKAAVPIYKIEQWMSRIKAGNLNAELHFREADEMKQLSKECNEAMLLYRQSLKKISASVKHITESKEIPLYVREDLGSIRNELDRFQFE